MNTIRLVALAMCLLLVSAMALTACGGDDDSDSEDTGGNGSEATATTAAEDEPTPAEEGEEATPTEDASSEGDDGDSGGGGEGVSDACSLLSQSDVSAALGEEVQAPVLTYTSTANVGLGGAQATVSTCNYVSPSGFSSISLTVWSAPGEDDAIQEMAELACMNKESVGVGDVDCWYDDGHLEVQVASNDVFLDIFVTSQGDTTEILETLSSTAVGNLP